MHLTICWVFFNNEKQKVSQHIIASKVFVISTLPEILGHIIVLLITLEDLWKKGACLTFNSIYPHKNS